MGELPVATVDVIFTWQHAMLTRTAAIGQERTMVIVASIGNKGIQQTMRMLIKLLIALVAAGSGALLGVFIAWAFVNATYSCAPQPSDPCDAGAMRDLA